MGFNNLILHIIYFQCRITQLKLYYLGNMRVTFWQTEFVVRQGVRPGDSVKVERGNNSNLHNCVFSYYISHRIWIALLIN